jgi:PAS domain S-box-containing protein
MQQSYSFIHSNSRVTTDRVGDRVARIASSIVIVVGCLVLIGWQLDLWWLKSVMPGAATMKANTAMCFLWAGISLKLQTRQRQTDLISRIGTGCATTLGCACAFAIMSIAFLTICEYIFGWNLGIDELLFRDPAALATSHPGRMGINTAIGLSFTGAALWLIERQERQSPSQPQHQVRIDRTTIAQILTVVASLIALQSIVGYAYNVRVFYQLSVVTTSMALHTALTLGILCVGILVFTRDRGFMRALTSDLMGSEVARRFIPLAILVPLLVGWLILQGLQANLYDPNFALSLMSMSMVVIWLGLIRKNAGMLNRVDYDRQQIQATVQQQLGEIEAIYRSAPIGLSYISSKLKFIRINKQLAQIDGLPVSEHIGRTIREVLPEMADIIEPIYRQVIESGEPILDLEVSGSTSAQPGENRCWLASYHPHQDAQGRVMGVSAVIKEITDRKRLEMARIAAEQERDRFFNLSLDLLAIGNFEGYFVRLNPAFEQILGFTHSELMAQPFINFVHPDDREHTLTGTRSLTVGDPVMDFENRYLCKDGSYRWVSWSAMPYLQSNVWYAIGHDITERKQVEAELRESEERFHTLADNMSQFAWTADASGWLSWYNRRWFEYTGTTLEEMQGWGWQQVHHPEHLDRVVAHFRHHLEIGEEWEDTFPLRGRDGTYRWFLSRAIPIVDETGQVLRWFGTNTDITDLKQAQADLQTRHQELDSFAHIVSHDLKAPLRAIANLSQWIEDDLEGVLTADTQAQMTLLRSRVDRMRATIDGLLDYARIGRTEGKTEPVAVSELVVEVIDSLAPPPTFSIAIDPNLPTLDTNRVLLFQVFANLIGNGIKHHDRLDGSIQISGRECGDLYEFVVADDGPGIAPEYQANIFTIFQTGNSRNTQDSTGIGLAIVKKIVESAAGTIRLESQIGLGTTFYFTWAK